MNSSSLAHPTRTSHKETHYNRGSQQISSMPPSTTRNLSIQASTAPPRSNRDNGDTSGSANTRERLAIYEATIGQSKCSSSARPSQPSESAQLVPLLALQSYHLPGNSWCQDWWQFMSNNHPVFGICCHHPLHPIGACTRIVALLGSTIFGLAMTNMFYLFYLRYPRFNQEVITLITSTGEWTLTTGMLLLWTAGGSVHTAYNLLMWHIAACACCRPGGCFESAACCASFGKHLLRVFVVIIVALGAIIILTRVAITNTDAGYDDNDDDASTGSFNFLSEKEWVEGHNAQEFQFLLGYLVEMVLALFIYYPLGGTILFSGVLGCGKLPLLGGRPREVAAEERRDKRKESRELRSNRTGSTLASPSTADVAETGQAAPVANEEDVELVWTPQAVREFEGRS